MAHNLGLMVVYASWSGTMEPDLLRFSHLGRSAGLQTMAIENQASHVLSPLFSPLIIPGEGGLGGPDPEFLWWM